MYLAYKHFDKEALESLVGTSDLTKVDRFSKNWFILMGYVEALEEYEINKQKKALGEVLSQMFKK